MSSACCDTPPVSHKYQPKGKTLKASEHGLKPFDEVYVTGTPNGKTALICVFDIFGFYPQTQQGADILADSLGTVVYMPDYFNKNPYSLSDFLGMQQGKEGLQKKFYEWFGANAPIEGSAEKSIEFVKSIKAKESGAENWKFGIYGYCWGGQVAFNAGAKGTPFTSLAAVHPFGLESKHAELPVIPVATFLSKGEVESEGGRNAETDKLLAALKEKKLLTEEDAHEYPKQEHGYAAARANLLDEENKKAYEETYAKLVTFFKKTLA